MSTTEYRLSINLTAEEADDDGAFIGSTNVLIVDVTTDDLTVAVATLGSAVDVLAHRQHLDAPAQEETRSDLGTVREAIREEFRRLGVTGSPNPDPSILR